VTAQDTARAISILGYLILMLYAFKVVTTCEQKLNYLGWVFLAFHGLIFYAVIAIDGYDNIYDFGLFGYHGAVFYNFWSTALRVHSLVVAILTLATIYRTSRGKLKNGC
jgi:hypothetical protein